MGPGERSVSPGLTLSLTRGRPDTTGFRRT